MADVVIIGAGPTGCATALAFAAKGAEVLLTEAQPRAAERFAGEWMHPPGVRQLSRLGVDVTTLTRSSGNGFVLTAPGEEPVQLPYSRGHSLARIHHELVIDLRRIADENPRIEYRPGAAFRGFEDGGVIIESDKGRELLRPTRVVGADGRNSKVRAALNAPGGTHPISFMMGVEMRGARLPFEGMGHVIAGGPGPALLYRVDDDIIRGCLDVPTALGGSARKKDAIYEGFRKVFPRSLHQSFQESLERPTVWAATRFQPRTFFGRDNVWLAGDSVGHLHPVTGMGMTLGMLDAVACAECSSLSEYEAKRSNYVVELLTNVLYHVLQRNDESAQRIRKGLFAMLRGSASERIRTMRILTGEDENPASFITAFARATGVTLAENLPLSVGELATDLRWLKWPLSAALSTFTGPSPLRMQSTFTTPFSNPRSILSERFVQSFPLRRGLS